MKMGNYSEGLKGNEGRRANIWVIREYSVAILGLTAQPGGKGTGPSGCLLTDLLIKHKKAIVLC